MPQDCYIECQYWPAKRGTAKPTPVVTCEALGYTLYRDFLRGEERLFGIEQVAELLELVAQKACENEATEGEALGWWNDDADGFREPLGEEDEGEEEDS
jgi:hypothetical protein